MNSHLQPYQELDRLSRHSPIQKNRYEIINDMIA